VSAVVDGSAPGRWRWLRCPAAGDPGPQPLATVEATCTPIEEAGGSALYVVRAADLGSRLRVLARYDDGAVPSAATAVVQAPLLATWHRPP
jgi:hypothetical protein